ILREVLPEAATPSPDAEQRSGGPFTTFGALAAAVLAFTVLYGFRFSNRAWFFGSLTLPLLTLMVVAGIWVDSNILSSQEPWQTAAFGAALAALAIWFRWPRMTGLRKLYRGVEMLQRGEFEQKLAGAARFSARLHPHGAASLSLRRIVALLLQAAGVAALLAFLLYSASKSALEDQGFSAAEAMRWIDQTLPGGEDMIFNALIGGMLAYLAGRMLSYREGRPLIEGGVPIAALFLRSFSDDSEKVSSTLLLWKVFTLGIVGRVRVEEALAQDLEPLGAFVGIGQPGERLPKLGAARIYAADDEWQDLVRDLMERAEVVLMMAGASHWVAWEAAGLRETGKLGRTLIVLPQKTVIRRRDVLANLAAVAPELAPVAALPDEELETLRAVHIPNPGVAPRLYRARERTDMTYRVIQMLFFADLEAQIQV
ncbi:MAG: hypothetical protein KTR21_14085, partial [Rhodobacteraceae bacterium]|nr:hypothetical protein [Paracoccaceae bacterium]